MSQLDCENKQMLFLPDYFKLQSFYSIFQAINGKGHSQNMETLLVATAHFECNATLEPRCECRAHFKCIATMLKSK